jgi:hypothetical protein
MTNVHINRVFKTIKKSYGLSKTDRFYVKEINLTLDRLLLCMKSLYVLSALLLTSPLYEISYAAAKPFIWPSVEVIVTQSKDQNTLVAQSGEVKWTISQAEYYLKRYRAWLNWETSAPQPLSTLSNISALRRLLISALEREVIVAYVKSKHLDSGNSALNRVALRDWLMKVVPGAIRPNESGLDDFIRGRLKMRADTDLTFFWKAAEDAYWVQQFKSELTEKLKIEDAEKEWRRQGTLMSVWLLQIPRVPTSSEITQAAKELRSELKNYYQAHLELFSQPLRLLVDPFWIRGGKSEVQRLEISSIRQNLVNGEPLEVLHERHPQLVKGSSRTLRGRSIPKHTEIKEGAITPVRLTRYGWTFYLIKRVYPKYVRSLAERSVEREVAAAVLRERDELPRARSLAHRARLRLIKGDSPDQLKKWARSNRIRISMPDPFFESTQKVVPTIGLSPELHQQILDLNVGEVSDSVLVRQHYVVAKLLQRKERKEKWDSVKDAFLKSWKVRRASQVLDEWLTKHLKNQPRWIKTKTLQQFRPEMLQFESSLDPTPSRE